MAGARLCGRDEIPGGCATRRSAEGHDRGAKRDCLRSELQHGLSAYRSSSSGSIGNKRRVKEGRAAGWISRYAWGDDYHEVLRAKLEDLLEGLREQQCAEPFEARVYADTGPLNERVLAKHAGLGWLGKNTLLLNERIGSFFFLGVILTTLDLQPSLGTADVPPADRCGSCRKCIEACPTGALVDAYVMDARRCISYLTIELRAAIPEELREPMGQHVFGCDICQDVCPWNRNAPVTQAMEFQPRSYGQNAEGATEQRSQAEAGRVIVSASPGMAGVDQRTRVSRDVFREPDQENEMERVDAERLHCIRKFKVGEGFGGWRARLGSAVAVGTGE